VIRQKPVLFRLFAADYGIADFQHPFHGAGNSYKYNADSAGFVQRLLLLRLEQLSGKCPVTPPAIMLPLLMIVPICKVGFLY